MNKNNKLYITTILFVILPFLFYYWNTTKLPKIEKFQTDTGCYWKYLDGPCVTSNFSPSMVNIVNKDYTRNCSIFKDNETCIGKDNIIEEEDNRYYYCQSDGKCTRRLIDIKHASANNCDYNNLSERMNPAFIKSNVCNESLDTCGTFNTNKEKCITNSNCGWCTDSTGNGKCVSGTPTGPNNQTYKCKPQTGHTIYNYTFSQPTP
jgi:hypothetical protein